MRGDFDIAVIGSGFAGSLTAMIARRIGRSVIVIERGRHPRFAIGESSTPLANLLLEELAARYDLPRLRPFVQWGSWQRAHPEVACGLKRGFTFFHHHAGEPFAEDVQHWDQLLVAASPRDEVADTHWFRADFDHFLVREAQAMGVEYLDGTKLESIGFGANRGELRGRRGAQPVTIRARFVVDASGPRGFLHRALGLGETPLPAMPPTQGLYAHFWNVARWDALHPSRETPPYPVDDAAVHHVFEGGWVWVLRFNNGITSAGAAVTDALAAEVRLSEGVTAWDRLLARLPSVQEMFADAKAVTPFVHAPRLPFQSGGVSGPNWVLLPSAAGFVDPLLSTGIPLALRGISRLAAAVEKEWGSGVFAGALREHASATEEELRVTAGLIGALYANMRDFELFKRLSLLYFAAASFSETARRLNKPELARGFLLCRHPEFGPRLASCAARALQPLSSAERAGLLREIDQTIAPVDVAGLGDRTRRDWYPARAEDLLAASCKLGATADEVRAMLARCGFPSSW